MTGLIIGIAGLLTASFGAFQKSGSLIQKHCYLWGAVLLGISGYLSDSAFYVALEIVGSASAAIAFTRASPKLKATVPIISTIVALVWLYHAGELTQPIQYWAAAGLTALALGFAVNHPLPVLLGAVLISTTSFIKWLSPEGGGIDAIFAWLNVVFTISTSIGLYRYYRGDPASKSSEDVELPHTGS